MVQRIRAVVIALLGIGFAMTPSKTKGDEFYYAMIFGSQSKPNLLQYTHTWATFIRAVGEGPDANNYSIYQHTISWLPQSLDIRTWSLFPEPGVNLDLYRTLEAVYRDGEHVTMWGPFRIHPMVYERSLRVNRPTAADPQAELFPLPWPGLRLISICLILVSEFPDSLLGESDLGEAGSKVPGIRDGKPGLPPSAPAHLGTAGEGWPAALEGAPDVSRKPRTGILQVLQIPASPYAGGGACYHAGRWPTTDSAWGRMVSPTSSRSPTL